MWGYVMCLKWNYRPGRFTDCDMYTLTFVCMEEDAFLVSTVEFEMLQSTLEH
jgi:hypothetical protein